MNRYAIIMSGGRGKRFWPLSQLSLPKQFLNFAGDGSLFTQTFQNLRKIIPASHIFTVTNELYHPIILEQVPDFVPENIILEPIQNNTAPCVALGLVHIRKKSPDALVIILPSDHYVENKVDFVKSLESAFEYARDHADIVTFGIKPDFPHTGYGYLEAGASVTMLNGFDVKHGVRFVEKPNLETAERFLRDEAYYWNSGIFCARIDVMFDAFKTCLPVIYKNIVDYEFYIGSPNEKRYLFEIYERMPKISFDFGVMEYVKHLVVIPIDVGWNDVGSWSSLRRLHEIKADGNLILGEHLVVDAHGVTVVGSGKVAIIGIDNVIVASSGDYVLVCSKDNEHHIQNVVDQLEINNRINT